eukprot:TRINITY_DN328_c0_g2_i2.p1 TRINITY_DN328_c0_g2~~TRINITY_DN328_c0_g2_i2.p1  ORF type:complete len:102 (+),score=16.57 TRINITY_DN328_c0_g2_i2:427-732(+)
MCSPTENAYGSVIGLLSDDIIKKWSSEGNLESKMEEEKLPEVSAETEAQQTEIDEMISSVRRMPKFLLDTEQRMRVELIEALQKQIERKEKEISAINSNCS